MKLLKFVVFIALSFNFTNQFYASEQTIQINNQNWSIDIVDEEGKPFNKLTQITIATKDIIKLSEIHEILQRNKALHDNGYILTYKLKGIYENNQELREKYLTDNITKITKEIATYIELVVDENPTIATNPAKCFKQLSESCTIM